MHIINENTYAFHLAGGEPG